MFKDQDENRESFKNRIPKVWISEIRPGGKFQNFERLLKQIKVKSGFLDISNT